MTTHREAQATTSQATVPLAATIAVLPFEHLGEDPRDAWFARGFVEEVRAALARFTTLGVVHPKSAAALAGAGAAPADVSHWLRGSVQRTDAGLRVWAELVDAAGGRQVWSERYDAPAAEAVGIQEEIAACVAGALAIRVDGARLGRARRTPIANLEVYDCWLRGMDHLRRGTVEDDDRARDLFTRALALDPHYARAHAGLSLSWFNEWSCQLWAVWDEREQAAFEAARRAAELEDDDAMVHLVLARVLLYRRAFPEAQRHLERALELNPNEPDVLAHAALCLGYLGDGTRARALAERAIRLNPYHDDWYLGCLALAHFALRELADGVRIASRAPDAVVDLPAYLAGAHARLGDAARAREYVDRFLAGFVRKITFGREPDPGEPVRWLVHVNPFRREEDVAYLVEGLRLAGLPGDPDEQVRPTTAGPQRATMRRADDHWIFAFEGQEVRLRDVKGFHDLAALVALPGEAMHCLDLAGRTSESGDEVLDQRARAEIRSRIRDLQARIDAAEADGDRGGLRVAQAEMDRLVEELSSALGLGGRARVFGSASERARSAVTWRIRSAIRKIGAAHPALGRHLENSVRTGTYCSYRPERSVDWSL